MYKTINKSEPKKYISINISGPFLLKNGMSEFEVELAHYHEDAFISQSKTQFRHFNEIDHPLFFAGLKRCLEENRQIKCVLEERTISHRVHRDEDAIDLSNRWEEELTLLAFQDETDEILYNVEEVTKRPTNSYEDSAVNIV